MTFLKPAEGRTVHLPDGTPLPDEGADLEDSLFIRRRIADGDLIEADRPPAPQPDPIEPASETADAKKPKGGK